MHDAARLFLGLHRMDLIDEEALPYWWPGYGTFRILPAAILTQQARWEKVRESLEHLEALELMTLEALAAPANLWKIASAIVPSGLYNQKAKKLHLLAKAVLEQFGDFPAFQEGAHREWLLRLHGIGPESADALLCYGCRRPVMVVDRYTTRLLESLDYTFSHYDEAKGWLEEGIMASLEALQEATGGYGPPR